MTIASTAVAVPSTTQALESRIKRRACSAITLELFSSAFDCVAIVSELLLITVELFSIVVELLATTSDRFLIVSELFLSSFCDCTPASTKAS